MVLTFDGRDEDESADDPCRECELAEEDEIDLADELAADGVIREGGTESVRQDHLNRGAVGLAELATHLDRESLVSD